MIERLIFKRNWRKYKKELLRLVIAFTLSISFVSFANSYCDSVYNYDYTVLFHKMYDDWTCDIRIRNISQEESELYKLIDGIDLVYQDGNADIILHEGSNFQEIKSRVQDVFNSLHLHNDDEMSNTSPAINIYYGKSPNIEVDKGTRIGTNIIQVIMSFFGVVAIVLIYSDYMNKKTVELRILFCLGMSNYQIEKQVYIECLVIYLIACIIGVPLGILVTRGFCSICEVIDMSKTNAVYPVFMVKPLTIIIVILIGYLLMCISSRLIFRRILKMESSISQDDSVLDFSFERFRNSYEKIDRNFDRFISKVLMKRISCKERISSLLISVMVAFYTIMINIADYTMKVTNSNGLKDQAAVAAGVSNSSLFIVGAIYTALFCSVLIIYFTKQKIVSLHSTIEKLLYIGADMYRLSSVVNKEIVVLGLKNIVFGYAGGMLISRVAFSSAHQIMSIGILSIIGNAILVAMCISAYLLSSKTDFNMIKLIEE